MMRKRIVFRLGLDVGSTTAKIVVVGNDNRVIHSKYVRHNTRIIETVLALLDGIKDVVDDSSVQLTVTGSAGYGLSEKLDMKFIQEVVSTSAVIKAFYPKVKTLIDIGGEDSKIIFFSENRVPDIRMNGSCAGGTGAFIDQIASLLNVSTQGLNDLAKKHEHIYPIASRCGVFAKTDVQNLLSRKIPLPDIAASTFQAVVIQTMNSLARGYDIEPKVMFIGGPLKFLSELKKSFIKNLNLKPENIEDSEELVVVPAWGAAISNDDIDTVWDLSDLKEKIIEISRIKTVKGRLNPLFKNEAEKKMWTEHRMRSSLKKVSLNDYKGDVAFLGIDSGSTTTKISIVGERGELLFNKYSNNDGDPVSRVREGLKLFLKDKELSGNRSPIHIVRSTVTGYGEDLIKAAFAIDKGVVETIAHYTAARSFDPDVSFILDIGGQDMKAIFIENGIINRIELNESCSSGCGSFIQTFGNTLGFKVADFADIACNAEHPADLGTRCTVFMNSKVKQSLRENASIEDISAGLAISVIKNALYKVLKLKSIEELGDHVVVQGGTFRNPAVHRALEVLIKRDVVCSDMPEMMGAYGAALISLNDYKRLERVDNFKKYYKDLKTLNDSNKYKTRLLHCKGCVNNCTVTKYTFNNGNTFYTGNKCEKIFSNKGEKGNEGFNFHEYKYKLLFDREILPSVTKNRGLPKLGIPRVLNMYENYPFWHGFLTSLGFDVEFSDESENHLYEKGIGTIMSDNVCFPAKLSHGHILSLITKKVDRIFYPMEFFQKKQFKKSDNSFNCPVVSGYADVIRNSMDTERKYGIPIDSPVINFDSKKLLFNACFDYAKNFGIKKSEVFAAFKIALKQQRDFKDDILKKGSEIIKNAKNNPEKRIVVVLAGRPYHIDPLINHKIPGILSGLGVDILTEDAVPETSEKTFEELQVISQWEYPNRIYNAAQWVSEQDSMFQLAQFNSFGCGPDAIVTDEVSEILRSAGKIYNLIRIDDIASTGSVILRLRSMIESLRLREELKERRSESRKKVAIYKKEDRRRTILAPWFSDFYSPVIPSIFEYLGYKLETLPPPDKESVTNGLKYANNEICYPATVVVGDIVKALKSGNYKRDEIAVGITQTGGQCRATSYLSLIKKAMITAGFEDIPVVSVGTRGLSLNPQPGFRVNWIKVLPMAFVSIVFSDALSGMYYSSVAREKIKGSSKALVDKYFDMVKPLVANGDIESVFSLLTEAVNDFNVLKVHSKDIPKIGIVGEIYIKYNAFGQNHVVDWLIEQGVEVFVPPLMEFFFQIFVNWKTNKTLNIRKAHISDKLISFIEHFADKKIKKVNKIMQKYRFFEPYNNIHDLSKKAERVVSLANQYGEGWLIPAEVSDFAEHGINQVVSIQPFGCIANHIISKGIEKRMKELYPNLSLVFLDFDNDISEINIINRLYFIINGAKEQLKLKNIKVKNENNKESGKDFVVEFRKFNANLPIQIYNGNRSGERCQLR